MNKFFDFKIKLNKNLKFIICPSDVPEPYPEDIGNKLYNNLFSKNEINKINNDYTKEFIKYEPHSPKKNIISPLNKKSNLDLLKKMSYAEYQKQKCLLCFYNYKPEDNIKILNCKHYFHENCINEFIKEYNGCPFCKK